MIIEKEGDMFATPHAAYAQGVSNLGKMHAGIAIEFRKRYPEMFRQYKDLCHQNQLQPGDCFFYRSSQGMPSVFNPAVFNLITQDTLSHASEIYLQYSIRKMHMIAMREQIEDIAMPKIGCGLGGLKLETLIDSLRPFISDPKHHVTLYSDYAAQTWV